MSEVVTTMKKSATLLIALVCACTTLPAVAADKSPSISFLAETGLLGMLGAVDKGHMGDDEKEFKECMHRYTSDDLYSMFDDIVQKSDVKAEQARADAFLVTPLGQKVVRNSLVYWRKTMKQPAVPGEDMVELTADERSQIEALAKDPAISLIVNGGVLDKGDNKQAATLRMVELMARCK